MRPIEVLILVLSLSLTLRWLLTRTGATWTSALSLALVVALVAHATLEGWRKPMLPIYFGAILLLICIWLLPVRAGSRAGIALGVAGLLGLTAATLIAAYLRPVYRLPVPAGPYAVGVTELPLQTSISVETAVEDPEKAPPRARLWYPAERSAAYRPGLKDWLTQPAKPAGRALATPEAEPAALPSSLPLLVYFPGWPGTGVENYALVRDLASEGYVVATLQYPQRLPGMSEAEFAQIAAALEAPADYSSETAYVRTVAQSEARVRKRARDGQRVLDALLLETPETASVRRIAKRLDPEHVGAVGFSLGGAVAAESSLLDARYRAVVNIDGRHWAEGRAHAVKRPYLLLTEPLLLPSEADLQSPDPYRRYNAREDLDDYRTAARHIQTQGGLHVVVSGTGHMNFTDQGLISPWPRLTGGGPIDARRALRIASAYVRAFFGRYLKGQDSPLLHASPPQYPEVAVHVYPGAAIAAGR